MEIKGNPNATITMYQAAPSRDLRKGDLITPFLSDAQYYVDQSKVTQEEVRDADKARRRQEQINKTGAVDLQQERLFNQMEGISDILGRPSQATPSTIHTYELKAGDVRWDGNNGWARWGYFPSNVVGIDGNIPLFSKASRSFSDGNSNESINRREAVKVAEERTKETPRGEIPFYNLNASDIALEAAIEFNQDPLKTAPNDIPTFSKAMPSNLQEAANTVGVATPKQSLGTRMIDFASNPIASIKKQFKDFRTNYIDNFDAVDKRIIKGSEENDEVRRANNTADTAVMAAIRLADRARGIFQQMLLKGFPVDQIEGMPSLTKVVDLEISTRYNPLIEGDTSTGGLMQILSALQSDPEVDLEGVFSLYAKLKRVKKLNDKGIEIASPIGSKELQAIENY
jgi:hypothetical protein